MPKNSKSKSKSKKDDDDEDIATPINWYKLKPVQKFTSESHNPQFAKHNISVPFRAVVIGSSGSGKTNWFCNLIRAFKGTFNHIYVFTRAQEPLYDFLADTLDSTLITIYYDDLAKLSSVPWYGQSLCVFDDMVNEKNQQSIQELFIRGRKIQGGISLLYLSQSYFAIPKIIRLQANYIFLLKLSSIRDIKMMMSEYSLGATKEQLHKMYEYCRQNGQLESFFMIDIHANDDKTYRKNFTEFLIPSAF